MKGREQASGRGDISWSADGGVGTIGDQALLTLLRTLESLPLDSVLTADFGPALPKLLGERPRHRASEPDRPENLLQ